MCVWNTLRLEAVPHNKYYPINDITSSVGDEDVLYGTFLAGKVVLWGEMAAFMPSLMAEY